MISSDIVNGRCPIVKPAAADNVDSQTLDCGERAYTIGMTAAETLGLNTTYWTDLEVNKWKTSPKDVAYEQQQDNKHGAGCDSDPDAWCVDTDWKHTIFNMGDYSVEFENLYFTH